MQTDDDTMTLHDLLYKSAQCYISTHQDQDAEDMVNIKVYVVSDDNEEG